MKRTVHALLRTLLPACLILLLGVAVLYGVRGLLPEHIGEYHTYSAVEQHLLPLPEESKELTLYPWKQLTQMPEDEYEITEAEPLLLELAHAFGLSNVSVDLSDAELLCNRAHTILGVRNVSVVTETYYEIDMNAEGLTSVIEETDSYRLSFALESGKTGETICFFWLEREERQSSEDALQNGYAALCGQADAPFETETAFARFLSQYGSICESVGFSDALSAFASQMESGVYSSFLYENDAYFCYTGDYGSLTLICDPLTQTVTGFSLETV